MKENPKSLGIYIKAAMFKALDAEEKEIRYEIAENFPEANRYRSVKENNQIIWLGLQGDPSEYNED